MMRIANHGLRWVRLTIPCLIVIGLLITAVPVQGSQLSPRSLTLSDGSPNAQAMYNLAFEIPSSSTLGSIRLQFCTNDPLIGTPCNPPPGFNIQTAVLSAQSGETGFALSPSSTANVLILSRIPTAASAGPVAYELSNVTNPSAAGSYYARLETFASDDATGPNSDAGGLAFSITNLVRISAEVPPYLTFCTAIIINALDCGTAQGDYVDFGVLSPAHSSTATSQMLVITNAVNGYVLGMSGSTLTSGNNIINALANPGLSQPGTAQFGLNLRANTVPPAGSDVVGPGSGLPSGPYNQPNYYVFKSGDIIAASPVAEDYRKYTASYLVNVAPGQPPGIYASTITFIATGNF